MPTSAASYDGSIRWFNAPTVQDPFTVTYTLAGTNTLNGIYLWNYQEEYLGTYYGGRGIKDAIISFSTDGGTNWDAGTAIAFAKAADSMNVAPGFVALSNVSANAVKLTITSNYGDADRTGFNEIRFTAVPEPASLVLLALTTVTLLRRRR